MTLGSHRSLRQNSYLSLLSLAEMGVSVTIVQRPKQLLAPLDADMASFVHAEMRRHGVALRLGETVTGFRQDGDSVLTLLDGSEPLHSDNATYKALTRATISEALGLNGDPEEVDMLERKVEALNNKMLALVNESVSSGDGIEAHESEFMTLSQETELLKQRIAAIQESTAKDNGKQSRLEQIQAIISERESKCMEYNDSIVRQMAECIKVYPGDKLEIIFGGGYLVGRIRLSVGD